MRVLFIHILFFQLSFSAFCQTIDRSSLNTGGSSNNLSSGTISHTVGGLSISTGIGSSFILTQDFEQPDNKSLSTFNFPNAFSPNEDGVNDTWVVRFEEVYDDLNIQIINRWGDVMCEVNNYQSGDDIWNGQLNNSGPKSVDGTYFYLVESKSAGLKINGWLQIIR
ncbi:MAG: gliding motility-associated C-terminal domain-containing protein [Flavobacteriales bacterium]|nr:gliding motility-associated C-terminal domain-containing protein [Flavobacteriales bacterium]